jgi:hypothetical protein
MTQKEMMTLMTNQRKLSQLLTLQSVVVDAQLVLSLAQIRR